MSIGGRSFARFAALSITALALAGCINGDVEAQQETGNFIVEGGVEYEITGRDGRVQSGALNVTGIEEAADRFNRAKPLITITEKPGESREMVYLLDPERRAIEARIREYDDWLSKTFDKRIPLPGSSGLTPFLLMLHGRDWSGDVAYVQRVQGYDYTLRHEWNGTELTVHADSDFHSFRATYLFASRQTDLTGLVSVRLVSPGQDYTYTITSIPDEIVPYELAEESRPAESAWTPLGFDEFIHRADMPAHFSLYDAWKQLELDPRTSSWFEAEPELISAFYREFVNGVGVKDSSWELRLNLSEGEGHARVEDYSVAGASAIPVVTDAARGPARPERGPQTKWFEWGPMIENCARHAGVTPSQVTEVLFGSGSFAHGLEEYPKTLEVKFEPEEQSFVQVHCAMDLVSGMPISVLGGPGRFNI